MLKVSKSKPVKFWPEAFEQSQRNNFTRPQIELINSLITRFGCIYLIELNGYVYLIIRHWRYLDWRHEIRTIEASKRIKGKLFKGKIAPNQGYFYEPI